MRRLRLFLASDNFLFGFAFFLIVLVSWSAAVFALPVQYSGVQILQVKDGDTIRVRAEVWPDTFVETDVRVAGIDTPETRRGRKGGVSIPECELILGALAKGYAIRVLGEADQVSLVQVDPSATKYAGRISGDFVLILNGRMQLFSQMMISSGHAVEYSGGAREVWPCEES